MTTETFGRYQIKRKLGRGGMATVFLAHDPRFGRDVALKVLPAQFLHDEQFRARFEREARTIARLEHKAIVPVYDFGENDGQPYLVMRHMAGGSLQDHLKKGPLHREEIVRIMVRIASALDAAHSKGVIHRDLKPGNILFDDEGDAYLSDFGIVKVAGATADITGSGLVGTPAYMSPEQVHGDATIDGRSDVYTLGVILYELLTGRPPYQAETPVKVMMAHVLEPVPTLNDPDIPEAYTPVIERAMSKETGTRFQRAGDLAAALETAHNQSEKTVPADWSPPEIDQTVAAPDPFMKTTPYPLPDKPEGEHDATMADPAFTPPKLKTAVDVAPEPVGEAVNQSGTRQTLAKSGKWALWGCGLPTIGALSLVGLCFIGIIGLGMYADVALTPTPPVSAAVGEAPDDSAPPPTNQPPPPTSEPAPIEDVEVMMTVTAQAIRDENPGEPTPYPFTVPVNMPVPFEELQPVFTLPPGAGLLVTSQTGDEEAATFTTGLRPRELAEFYRPHVEQYGYKLVVDELYIDDETLYILFWDGEAYVDVVANYEEGDGVSTAVMAWWIE